jgi:YVTN family beta-propeller protein
MTLKLRLGMTMTLVATVAVTGPAAWARPAILPTPQAFVANSGSSSVTPIDLATGTAGAPIRVGLDPDAIVALPDGKTVYVANRNSGTVTPIDVVTHKAGRAIKVGKFPVGLAVTPDGKTVYVARSAGPNPGHGAVVPIATATGKVGKPVEVGPIPGPITITPDGRTALVISHRFTNEPVGFSITSISTRTGKAGKTLSLPGEAPVVAIAPGGTTAYVASEGKRIPNQGGSNQGVLTPIAIATMTKGQQIVLGLDLFAGSEAPDAVLFSHDGRWAYVVYPGVNGLDRVNLAKGKEVGSKIRLLGFPQAGVISPDGTHVYAEGQTYVNATDLSARTNAVVNLKVWSGIAAPYPTAQEMAMAPDGGTVYALSFGRTNGAVVPVRVPANIREKPITVGVKPVAIVIVP